MIDHNLDKLNLRIKSHPAWNGYIAGAVDQVDRERLRYAAQHNSMEVSLGGGATKTVPPVCETARHWVMDKPGTLREHGIHTLAYWGVTL